MYLGTCEDRDISVRVWNYALHRCMVTLSLDKAHKPSSIAFHPSGTVILYIHKIRFR